VNLRFVRSYTGLKSWRISKLSSPDPSKDSPYGIQADLIFPDVESVKNAFEKEGEHTLIL
jgi:hypothetical protein